MQGCALLAGPWWPVSPAGGPTYWARPECSGPASQRVEVSVIAFSVNVSRKHRHGAAVLGS